MNRRLEGKSHSGSVPKFWFWGKQTQLNERNPGWRGWKEKMGRKAPRTPPTEGGKSDFPWMN